MFTLSSRPYLSSAAPATGDINSADATAKFISSGYNIDALDSNEQSLVANKVFPKAQDAVLSRMFSGKGMFETTQKLQTEEQEAEDIEKGKMKAGEVSGPGTLSLKVTAGAVVAGPRGAIPKLKNGRPVVLPIDVNFGKVDSKQLRPGDSFEFMPGTEFYFTQHVSPTIANLFGKRTSTGSYVSEHPFSTRSIDKIRSDFYVTQGNAQYKTKKGETFYLPKGTPTNANEYGGKSVGKNWMVVSVDDYIKTLPESKQQALKYKADELKGLRIIVNPLNNSSVLRKFEGEYTTPRKNLTNSSISVLQNR